MATPGEPVYCDWRVSFGPECAFHDELDILFIANLALAGLCFVGAMGIVVYRQGVLRLPVVSSEQRMWLRPMDALFIGGILMAGLRFAQAAVVYFQVPIDLIGLEVFYEVFFGGCNIIVLYYLYAIIIILPDDTPMTPDGRFDLSGSHYNYSRMRETIVWLLGLLPLTNIVWAALTGYYAEQGNATLSVQFFETHYFAWSGYNAVEMVFYFVLGGQVLTHMRNSFRLTSESFASSATDTDVERRATFNKKVLEYRRMQFHVYIFTNGYFFFLITQATFGALRPSILSIRAWSIIFFVLLNMGMLAFYVFFVSVFVIADAYSIKYSRIIAEMRRKTASAPLEFGRLASNA